MSTQTSIRIDGSPARLEGKLFRVKLPPKGVHSDPQEQDHLIAGTGRCYACDCRGYKRSQDTNWCTCGHHWDRHS